MMERQPDKDPDLETVRPFRVLEGPKEVAENTFELRLKKPFGFRFKPGQAMKFFVNGVRSRTLSIASAPHEPYIMLAFRAGESEFKHMLVSLKKGDIVTLREPRGEMTYPNDVSPEVPVVMLAGGIGITPFMSIMKHAERKSDQRPFHLLHAAPRERDIPYKAEVGSLTTSLNLRTHYFLTSPDDTDNPRFARGRFRASDLDTFATEGAVFYIAGSVSMVTETRTLLSELGVPEERIRFTEFSGYKESDVFRS